MTTLDQVRVSDSLLAGARGVLPVAIVVVPVGLAFGAAAVAKGMTSAEATLLSMLSFTASAQFAALDFFEGKLHLLPVLMVMFAVSSRHLIMGATLYPSLRAYPRWRQYRSLVLLSDPNYADTMRASRQDRTADLTRLMGGGLMLWTAWATGTLVGSLAGSSFSDLSRFGVDVILVSYFTTVVMDTPREERLYPILGLVALTAYAGHFLLSDGWNIVVAALVGGAARWVTAND